MAISAAFPSTIMEAAFGRLHNNGGAAFGGLPIVVGEVANIGKTYANMYRIFMYVYISYIFRYVLCFPVPMSQYVEAILEQ